MGYGDSEEIFLIYLWFLSKYIRVSDQHNKSII